MTHALFGNNFLTMVVLVFIALMLLMEGLYLLWRSHRSQGARQLQQRLQSLQQAAGDPTQINVLRERALSELPTLQRTLARLRSARHMDRLLQQAGSDWSVSRLLLTSAACAVVALMAASQLARLPGLPALAVGAACALLPWFYLRRQRARRLHQIERQLPEALDLVTRALRAGHTFPIGMQMIAQEMRGPIAAEFSLVHDEISFGASLEQALTHLSERVPITDLRYFVVSVLIQRESGGNLTEILSNLSRLIRERLKLLSKVRVLSADGRLSGWIIGLMPFALAGAFNLVNPKFISTLWTDPIGITIVKYMLGLMAVGVLMLRHIVRIRV
ncbi:MAG: type II secretion system F family protein [Proteobacteria bacterium]|nr:type II secretion system F family protein [Pseudomonadota bacterium]